MRQPKHKYLLLKIWLTVEALIITCPQLKPKTIRLHHQSQCNRYRISLRRKTIVMQSDSCNKAQWQQLVTNSSNTHNRMGGHVGKLYWKQCGHSYSDPRSIKPQEWLHSPCAESLMSMKLVRRPLTRRRMARLGPQRESVWAHIIDDTVLAPC